MYYVHHVIAFKQIKVGGQSVVARVHGQRKRETYGVETMQLLVHVCRYNRPPPPFLPLCSHAQNRSRNNTMLCKSFVHEKQVHVVNKDLETYTYGALQVSCPGLALLL